MTLPATVTLPAAVPLLAIVGPTASGKSALAVAVAEQRAGEIVGTDSMQVYRGMTIGTAAPTAEDRSRVPHHMVEVWDPDHLVTVAEFQAHAREAIDEIHERGRLPVLVGGSGLYVSAVLDDLRFPGTDPAIRADLEAELAELGSDAMHRRLADVDPAAAKEILPSNGRRIVRALEVIAMTGQPFAARLPAPVEVYPSIRVGLDIERSRLDERIAERVERMWEEGFVDEVRRLASRGLSETPTASRALGYQQVLACLAGDLTEAQAREETIAATRKFARRQQRWFRRDERITWLPYDSSSLLDDVRALLDGSTET